MSEKTYNKCEDCRNYYKCDSAWDGDVACDGFKSDERTLFDRITESPEVLAKELVHLDCDSLWFAWVGIGRREAFSKREQAIAATVAKLKEVCHE
jgi:hypothetical protein